MTGQPQCHDREHGPPVRPDMSAFSTHSACKRTQSLLGSRSHRMRIAGQPSERRAPAFNRVSSQEPDFSGSNDVAAARLTPSSPQVELEKIASTHLLSIVQRSMGRKDTAAADKNAR